MVSHADITAATFELVLDGKTYKARPLTVNDIGEIEEWGKARVMSVVYKSLASNKEADEATRGLIIDRALKHVGNMSFTQESDPGKPSDLEKTLSTIKGMQLILWIAVRDHHADVKPEDMGSSSVLDLIHEQVTMLWKKSGFNVEEGRADANKKRRSKKTAKASSKKRKARKSKSR